MEIAKLVIAYIILILSSEFSSTYIRKATKIAETKWHKASALLWIFGYSPALISFCLVASFVKKPGLVVGSIVGSHILNIAIIFPIVYIVCKIPFYKVKTMASPFALLGAAVLTTITLLNQVLSLGEGLALLSLLPIYFLLFFKKLTFEQKIYEDLSFTSENLTSKYASVNFTVSLIFFAISLMASYYVIDGFQFLLNEFHLSEYKLGATLVAMVLSLPMFIRTYSVYNKNKKSFNPAALIITGMTNALILNLLFVLGGAAVINKEFIVNDLNINIDMSFFIGYSVLFAVLLLTEKLKTAKLPILMMLGYVFYLASKFLF